MAARQNKILAAGAPAPEFGLETPPAAPVLIVFFKVTCPICQLTLPYLNRLHQAGTIPVYGISQNDAEDTADFTREFAIEFPILFDSEDAGYPASNAYGISSVPSMFLLENGKITRVIEGWIKKEMQQLGVLRQGDNVPEWKAG